MNLKLFPNESFVHKHWSFYVGLNVFSRVSVLGQFQEKNSNTEANSLFKASCFRHWHNLFTHLNILVIFMYKLWSIYVSKVSHECHFICCRDNYNLQIQVCVFISYLIQTPVLLFIQFSFSKSQLAVCKMRIKWHRPQKIVVSVYKVFSSM